MPQTSTAALLHDTATRVTLGNSPLHAVPISVAQQLRRLLESSTALTSLTVHTHYTPPESLRLVLLGAARCRSLQHVRVIGGVSVLQSRMLMAALAHFTVDPPRRHGTGLHLVLEPSHLDDVAAGFLLRGLTRAERVVALDVLVAPTSQAAARAAARMLTRANPAVARNAQRLRMARQLQSHLYSSPLPLPPRRYSPPRFNRSPHSPHPPQPKPRGQCGTGTCFVCDEGCGVAAAQATQQQQQQRPTEKEKQPQRTKKQKQQQSTESQQQQQRQSTPQAHCMPDTPPSPRGQAIQQIRLLRGCVMDVNACVVRYQVVSRESIARLVTEMRAMEEQLAEKITARLTDMTMTLDEMEK